MIVNRFRPIVTLFLLFLTTSTFAQINVLKTDLFGFLRGRKNFTYERSFFDKFSGAITYDNQVFSTGEQNGQNIYELVGKGFLLEARYYPLNNRKLAPFGFFIGTSYRNMNVVESYTPNNIRVEGKVHNYTLISGYKFTFERVAFEVLGGYGVGDSSDFDKEERQNIDPFFADDKIAILESGIRIEVSFGIYFPKLKKL